MSINNFQFHIGDYLRKTRKLTAQQHGAYLLLLLDLYTNGGSIEFTDSAEDNAALQRLCSVRSKAAWEKKVKPVIFKFFIHTDNKLMHSTVLEKLEEIEKISDKKRNAAKRRWGKKPNKNNGGDMHVHSRCNANQKPKTISIKNRGEEGTQTRRLFDVISSVEGEQAWASWFDDGRVTVVDNVVHPKSIFFAKKLEQDYSVILKAAGFVLGEPKAEAG